MAGESISWKTYLAGRAPATPLTIDDVFAILQGGTDVKKLRWEDLVRGVANYLEDTGDANALVITSPMQYAAYFAGLPFLVKVAHTNTGPATLVLNYIGVKSIKKNGSAALEAGDLVAGQLISLTYDGTNFQLLSPPASDQQYAVATGAENAYAIDLTPAPGAYVEGMPIIFKANHTNTAAGTLAVNGMAAKAIKFTNGSDLSVGAIVAGALIVVIYDGTNFQLVAGAKPGGVPFGGEILWPVDTPLPDGYYAEQGASLARATYPEVFAIIGTTYGAADADHFNLPNPGGAFIRIWANGSSRDPDRTTRTAVSAPGATMQAGDHVGTEQTDQVELHGHEGATYGNDQNTAGKFGAGNSSVTVSTAVTSSYGGNETRPINVNRMLIMRCY